MLITFFRYVELTEIILKTGFYQKNVQDNTQTLFL